MKIQTTNHKTTKYLRVFPSGKLCATLAKAKKTGEIIREFTETHYEVIITHEGRQSINRGLKFVSRFIKE